MCNRFSCIVLTVGNHDILWTPPTDEKHSHEEIIRAAQMRDDGMGRFIRLECLPPFDTVTLDETDPAQQQWWHDHQHDIVPRVIALAAWNDGLYADYRAKRETLYADYWERETLYADYRAKCDALDADYKAKCLTSPIPFTRCVGQEG